MLGGLRLEVSEGHTDGSRKGQSPAISDFPKPCLPGGQKGSSRRSRKWIIRLVGKFGFGLRTTVAQFEGEQLSREISKSVRSNLFNCGLR